MRTIVIGFGMLVLALLILFRLAEINFVQGNVRLEIIVAVAALLFFFIGLYFNHKGASSTTLPARPVPVAQEPAPANPCGENKGALTTREHEVLLQMAQGHSNQEIAAALFLSESTVKTHVSNILFKLEAKRRTQAVSIAKKLGIIAA